MNSSPMFIQIKFFLREFDLHTFVDVLNTILFKICHTLNTVFLYLLCNFLYRRILKRYTIPRTSVSILHRHIDCSRQLSPIQDLKSIYILFCTFRIIAEDIRILLSSDLDRKRSSFFIFNRNIHMGKAHAPTLDHKALIFIFFAFGTVFQLFNFLLQLHNRNLKIFSRILIRRILCSQLQFSFLLPVLRKCYMNRIDIFRACSALLHFHHRDSSINLFLNMIFQRFLIQHYLDTNRICLFHSHPSADDKLCSVYCMKSALCNNKSFFHVNLHLSFIILRQYVPK